MKYKTLTVAMFVTLAFAASLFAGDEVTKTTTTTTTAAGTKTTTVYEVIKTDPNLSTFYTTKEVQTYFTNTKGEYKGPYTVFAPTNKVYTLSGDKLVTYYIMEGNYTPDELRKMNKKALITTSGDELIVEIKDEVIWVGNCQLPSTQLTASNGTVYTFEGPMTCGKK